jgi:hypothetical protein
MHNLYGVGCRRLPIESPAQGQKLNESGDYLKRTESTSQIETKPPDWHAVPDPTRDHDGRSAWTLLLWLIKDSLSKSGR